MKISVIIRARNCAPDLERCLRGLQGQAGEPEIVVVDNESTDATAKIAQSFGAVVVPLERRQFTWGRALNRGIAACRGDIAVLLSADASPADSQFLSQLTAPFADAQVAAVYGRQLPRRDAPIDEVARLAKTFDGTRRVYDASTEADARGCGMIVSNACAAIRRTVWEKLPYDEEIEGGEEGIWTRTALDLGYHAIYEPSARVFHSHDDPLFRSALRSVELYIKNRKLSGRKPDMAGLVHWIAASVRRRLATCARPGIPMRTRAVALARLPAEIATAAGAYALLRFAPDHELRSVLWDFRFS